VAYPPITCCNFNEDGIVDSDINYVPLHFFNQKKARKKAALSINTTC
jgi:hypothetical protein